MYVYIYIYTYYTIKLSGLGLASKTPIQTIFKNLTYGPGALSPTGRAQPTGSRPPGPHGAHHRAGAPGRRGRLRRPQGAPAGEGLAVARGAHKRTHTNARARAQHSLTSRTCFLASPRVELDGRAMSYVPSLAGEPPKLCKSPTGRAPRAGWREQGSAVGGRSADRQQPRLSHAVVTPSGRRRASYQAAFEIWAHRRRARSFPRLCSPL